MRPDPRRVAGPRRDHRRETPFELPRRINKPARLAIVTGDSAVPVQFDYFRYGRDYFFGAMLRFNDEDIAALLTVAGGAVSTATR